MIEPMIKPGLYRHYKGPLYQVTDVATHSESEEQHVVYRALYGEKGLWIRPLSMFIETVDVDGQEKPRFERLENQTAVREIAMLEIDGGRNLEFESAFTEAQGIISSMPGYVTHSLEPCVEQKNKYLLNVVWVTLEDHEKGFRDSEAYQEWKRLLHHFYDPFPVVEHFRLDV